MAFAITGVLGILACWKYGDWRHWRQYYPTILYVLIGDFVSDFLLCNKPLFSFGDFVQQRPVLDIAIMMLLYPCTVILYLSFYPNTLKKRILYILLWTGIFIAIEIVALLTGGCSYYNGWNIWYSVLLDLIMFTMLALHYEKPLLVWPISAALAFLVLWWFRIPLMA